MDTCNYWMSLACLLWFAGQTQRTAAETSHVNPLIGTAGHGHTFPGATVPFGMVQLSPDTHNEGWDWCSGYHYSDSSIMGFSHTHLSGTGRGELLDVLIMPSTGAVRFEPGSRADPGSGYRSRFKHQSEVAKAGYYSVMLEDYAIKAELTATTRAGFHRYTFSKDQAANLMIDLAHCFKTDTILGGTIRIMDDTLIAPSKTADVINSMLAQYDESGLLPVWPLCNCETNCMIGYHAVPVIVDACLKGIGGFDAGKAYEAMKKGAMQDGFGIQYLKKYNYLPRDLYPTTSVARTLEYAFDDHCIALMAGKLGKTDDAKYFARRAKAFENLLDTSIGFMRGRDSQGVFRPDFDPNNAVNATSDFIEGNSWQYTWFVPHAITSLVQGMGGKTGFVNKLDTLFSLSPKLDKDTPVDVSGLIGQYAHGNEPSHHVAYLFNYGDAPWKTQERVHQIMTCHCSSHENLKQR